MENAQVKLRIEPAKWSVESAMWLTQAVQQAGIAELRAQVEAGASLFDVFACDRHIGAFILRVDQTVNGAHGVIVAAAGRLSGFDFTVELLPHVEQMFSGVKVIRIHTARVGLAKKLADVGYVADELVFSKRVAA